MRISRRTRSSEHTLMLASHVANAADGRGIEGRVCGSHCDFKCHRCGSSACQCHCAPDCPHAASTLSSDPAFPLENGIVPLVFEMKRTGAFDPCWSCEGHAGPDGRLWKRPTVWFYCDAGVHLRLLAGGLGKMQYAGTLKTPWRVSVTFSDADNPEPTFALEPDLPTGAEASLADLQSDAAAIARSLPWMFAEEARVLKPVVR